jgi:hypothetical protein
MAPTFLSILADAGYLPHVDDDEVVFRVEGVRCSIETFAGDDTYARLITAFTLPEGVSRQRLLSQANRRNADAKAVKTTINFKSGVVAFSVEQFIGDPEHVRPIFERALAAMRLAADKFFADLEPRKSRRPRDEEPAA